MSGDKTTDLITDPEDDQRIMIEMSRCNHQFFSELFTSQKRIFKWCHRKQSLLIWFCPYTDEMYEALYTQATRARRVGRGFKSCQSHMWIFFHSHSENTDYTIYAYPSTRCYIGF